MITKRDIPLKKAMLLWRPMWACKGTEKPDLAIVEHCSGESRCFPYNQLPMSDGACCAYWDDLDTIQQKLELYEMMIELIYYDGIPVDKVMEACFCIPEFRETLSDVVIDFYHEKMKKREVNHV